VPRDQHNFLRNWTKTGTSPGASAAKKNSGLPPHPRWLYAPEDADKPVVHVSLSEARLFCSHYGWRLPHTWEWSYAAQGLDGRRYPWGNVSGCKPEDKACQDRSAVDGSHCPILQTMGTHVQDDQSGLQNVSKYPQGASPFGALLSILFFNIRRSNVKV